MPYPFQYSYYVDDTRATMTYPSGSMVTDCNDANGRAIWVSKTATKANCEAGQVLARWYAKVTNFWPRGVAKELTLGNGLVESTTFNTGYSRCRSRQAY
jgi:hypothetical protein